jgi:predicted AAA+ superfamily ATPase
VDFVIEHGRRLLVIEVKQTGNPGFRDLGGIQTFLQHHPAAVGGILFHGGKETRRMGENIVALPWSLITG